jgi:hypothetical protein
LLAHIGGWCAKFVPKAIVKKFRNMSHFPASFKDMDWGRENQMIKKKLYLIGCLFISSLFALIQPIAGSLDAIIYTT